MALALVPLVGCNSDDVGTSEGPPDPDGPAACASPDTIVIGQLYECTGTRKARLDVEICLGLVCESGDNWEPIQDADFGGTPLLPDEQILNVEQPFSPVDGNPPPTGACCDPNHPTFVDPDSVLETAYNDCAARACREIHDQLVELTAGIQAAKDALPIINFPDDGWAQNELTHNAHQRAIDSLTHYSKHLELPTGFKNCTNSLINDDGMTPHSYTLPDPADPGPGSLRSLVISQFDCPNLACAVAEDDPTTGGGGGGFCLDNPNWFKDNAAPSITGTGVPEEGTVILTLSGVDSEPVYTGVAVAYQRLSDCPADAVCPFALTDLRFDLQPITLGPIKLEAPAVSLDRPAFGTQIGDDVKLADSQLVLRIESPITLFGAPFLGGVPIPLFVDNHGTVDMNLSDGTLEVEEARFNLIMGALARLTIAPTPCDEE